MSGQFENLTDDQRTEIIAYLDGELDGSDADRVRSLLSENPQARREANELTVAWEALDSLDVIRASGEFTQNTLTSIQAVHPESGPLTRVPPRSFDARRGVVLGVWIAGIVLSGVIGFVAANWNVSQRSRELVNELNLLRELPKYERIQSAELIKELTKRKTFDAEP